MGLKGLKRHCPVLKIVFSWLWPGALEGRGGAGWGRGLGCWSRLNKNAQERGGSEGMQNLLFRAFRIHELLIHCIYSVYIHCIYTLYTEGVFY